MTKKISHHKEHCKEVGPFAKLTPEQVRKARTLCDKHVPQQQIAKMLGVSQPTISKLLSRKNYKKVA